VSGLSFKTVEAGRVALQTMQAFRPIRHTAFTRGIGACDKLAFVAKNGPGKAF
jgi:hypothetical protein